MLGNMILNNQLPYDLSQAGKCSQGCYFTQDLIFKQQTVPKTDILLQTPWIQAGTVPQGPTPPLGAGDTPKGGFLLFWP